MKRKFGEISHEKLENKTITPEEKAHKWWQERGKHRILFNNGLLSCKNPLTNGRCIERKSPKDMAKHVRSTHVNKEHRDVINREFVEKFIKRTFNIHEESGDILEKQGSPVESTRESSVDVIETAFIKINYEFENVDNTYFSCTIHNGIFTLDGFVQHLKKALAHPELESIDENFLKDNLENVLKTN